MIEITEMRAGHLRCFFSKEEHGSSIRPAPHPRAVHQPLAFTLLQRRAISAVKYNGSGGGVNAQEICASHPPIFLLAPVLLLAILLTAACGSGNGSGNASNDGPLSSEDYFQILAKADATAIEKGF
jgi:hypothetical protein